MEEEICVPPIKLKLLWKRDLLARVHLSWGEKEDRGKSYYGKKVFLALERYLNQNPVEWDFLPLAWELISDFQNKVFNVLKNKVKFGQCISYKELAYLCGIPKGYRAIGQALKNNPWPLIIPCHRVIRSDGALGGYSCGLEFKRFLLKLEGACSNSGKF